MILTVTLNPALDFSSEVDVVIAGEKLRCAEPAIHPGGGGVNVARAVCKLGGEATAILAAGGATGESMEDMLKAEGVPVEIVPISGQTRQSLAITETSTGKMYRFGFPGPEWLPADQKLLIASLQSHFGKDQWCVISGSMPKGADASLIKDVAELAAKSDTRLIVDTSGRTLDAMCETRSLNLDILRMDMHEAQEVAHQPLVHPLDFAEYAQTLIDNGIAKTIVIGLGATGNLAVADDGTRLLCRPPIVEVVSAVGAGDSFVGAMAMALSAGKPFDQAMTDGTAAAAAAVTTSGTKLCDLKTYQRLRPDVTIERL